MKILIIHNYYNLPGGEDEVVSSEASLLQLKGHEVKIFSCRNQDLGQWPLLRKVSFFLKDAFWSSYFYREVKEEIRTFHPDIVHIHNPFYLLSASIYDACRDQGVPIVQTLHNYRFLCPAGTFFREGHVCHDCTSHGLRQSVIHSCWQSSRLKTFLLTQILRTYRQKGIPQDYVKRFITPSSFTRNQFIKAGWPSHKIIVKANVVVPIANKPINTKDNYVLFVGALFDYKGIEVLLKLWDKNSGPCVLKIIGDGPFKSKVEQQVGEKLEYLGRVPLDQVRLLMAQASALIVPSLCYETFSRVIAEAYSVGTPVIASHLGALSELIVNGQTGYLFNPGDEKDLENKVTQLISNNNLKESMQKSSKSFFEESLGVEKNYDELMAIYKQALSDSNC